MGHLHQCDCNTFAVESSSRIMRLLAPLMSLNTATKNQSAISLRNRDRGLLVWALMLTEPRRDRRRILTRKFMSAFWETA